MQENIYTGQPCMMCGDTFSEKDDIVVCPECGTPYHRECWMREGACVNHELHQSGKGWAELRRVQLEKQRSAEKKAAEAEDAARRENGEGPDLINASLYDGVRLNPADPCCGLDPNEDMDGVKLSEVADYVQTNRFYYLPLFRLMKRTGRKSSFNFICLFFPEFYFANRRMWGMALLAMFTNMLLNFPATLTYMERYTGIVPPIDITTPLFGRIMQVTGLTSLLLSVFWCLSANHFYYRHVIKQVRFFHRIEQEAKGKPDFPTAQDMIKIAGGTRPANVLLAFIIEMAVALGAVAGLFAAAGVPLFG